MFIFLQTLQKLWLEKQLQKPRQRQRFSVRDSVEGKAQQIQNGGVYGYWEMGLWKLSHSQWWMISLSRNQ
ncbi:unnamed protein product [Microthlaspi erraticum]|uniref:Uncharacterized protein n=1 Tax=Microthlaspi erraticum TaxID=1685480 RepID=A0A6D2KH07_9BRAS|nr:unnamed protein product [Microthlaspi erraticum]